MAFMEKLRRNIFGVFGTIILFIILILFLWGDASQGTNSLNVEATLAGRINGEDITFVEFSKRVEEVSEQQRQSNPDAEIDTRAIEEQVWNEFVQNKILEQGASRLGIGVSDEQLKHILLYNPPDDIKGYFRDTLGNFDTQLYYQFMTNLEGFIAQQQNQITPEQAQEYRTIALQIQESVRRNYLVSALQNVVGSLYPASPTLLRHNYDLQNSKASGSFILLNANLVPDSDVQVSDEEVQKYYQEHKEEYRREASRSLRYSMLRLGPSAKDSQKVQTQFRRYSETISRGTTPAEKSQLFGEVAQDFGTRKFSGVSYTPQHEVPASLLPLLDSANVNDIIGPVRVDNSTLYVNVVDIRDSGNTWTKARHIVLRFDGNDSTAEGKAQLDSLKAVAEGIAAEARTPGTDFAELAKEKSDDETVAQNGGDIGWFNDKSPFAGAEEFKKAALAASVGQIVGPVRTQAGYHVIKIDEKSTRSYKLRAISFDITVSSVTRNLLRRKADELRTRITNGENFDSVAAELELQVLEAPSITTPNQPIAGSYALGSFAFNADAGDISNIIKLKDDALVVAQLSKVTPAGPAPLDEVKDQIKARLVTQKKVATLKARADEIHAKLTPGDSLATQAAAIDPALIVRQFTDQTMVAQFPDIGSEPRLTNAVFSMKAGEISKPIKGDRGYYIVQVNSITPADPAQYKADKEANERALAQKRSVIFNSWYQEQANKAEIERFWDR